MQHDKWSPTIDGVEMFDYPYKLVKEGKWANVPVIIGTNQDDGSGFVGGCKDSYYSSSNATGLLPTCGLWIPGFDATYWKLDTLLSGHWHNDMMPFWDDSSAMPDTLYEAWIEANFGVLNKDKIISLYETPQYDPILSQCSYPVVNNFRRIEMITGDYVMFCNSATAASMMSQKNPGKIFQFMFDHLPKNFPWREAGRSKEAVASGVGACHECEIPFVLHLVEPVPQEQQGHWLNGSAELDLSVMMSTAWTNFAHSGDPNVADRPFKSVKDIPKRAMKWEPLTGEGDHSAIRFSIKDGLAHQEMGTYPRWPYCKAFMGPYMATHLWAQPTKLVYNSPPTPWNFMQVLPSPPVASNWNGLAISGWIVAVVLVAALAWNVYRNSEKHTQRAPEETVALKSGL